MKISKLFSELDMSSIGMSLQRRRMNVISENLSNAENTRSADGSYYKRKISVPNANITSQFSGILSNAKLTLAQTDNKHIAVAQQPLKSSTVDIGNDIAEVVEDNSPPKMVHDPSHPDANEEGYVEMPNVNLFSEMVDMLATSKSFEANVVAINAAKNMAKDSLDI